MEVTGRRESGMQNTKSDGQKDILCQPCHGDGDNVPADGYCETCNEYFCSLCLKFHRKQSATKNHVIKSKDEMPKIQVQSDPCSELCADHKAEIVKFYCHEHDSVGCGDCMVLRHKSCSVQLVPDVSGSYGNSQELKEVKQKIEQLEKEILSAKYEIKHNLKAAEATKLKVIAEIKAFRKELNSYLDNVEAELVKEVEKLNARDASLLREPQVECEAMEKEMKEFWSKLHEQSDKINQLFVTAKLSQKRLKPFQTTLANAASKRQIQRYKFEPSKKMMAVKVKHTPLGSLVAQSETLVKENKKNIVDMKAHFVEKANVRGENEDYDCWITGLAMISRDEILLSDYQNISLKIFHAVKSAVTQTYKAHSGPWDVTVVDSETAAATIPGKGRILFVGTKNGLSESHSLKVRNGCKGIDHHNGVMAVSFENPAAVQILNVNGNILYEINDRRILDYPTYISLSSDSKRVFVSDKGKSAIYELTMDGCLKNTYRCESMTCPRGLAVTNDGTVVVCDESKSNTVNVIVPDTSEILPLCVQGVQIAFSVLVCDEQNKIYISDIGSLETNFIKMYDLVPK